MFRKYFPTIILTGILYARLSLVRVLFQFISCLNCLCLSRIDTSRYPEEYESGILLAVGFGMSWNWLC